MKRLLLAVLLVSGCSEDAPPPPPEKKPKPKVADVAVKPTPPKPPPAPTLDEKVRALRDLKVTSPTAYRKLQEGWAALLPEARSAAEKAKFKDELGLLDSEANKAYRALSKPVRAAMREALDDGHPELALKALEAWSIPPEFDFQGRLSLDRDTELALLRDMVAIDAKRRDLLALFSAGDLVRNEKAELARFLASPKLRVRVEGEKALAELRRVRSMQTGRARLAKLLAMDPAERKMFGEFRVTPGPSERRLAATKPAELDAILKDARGRLPDIAKAASFQDFDARLKEAFSVLEKGTSKYGFFPVTWYQRAEWKYILQGDLVGALTDLDEAISHQKNFVEARMAKALLLLEIPMPHEAEKELKVLARALPEPSKTAAVAALEKAKAKDHRGAWALIMQALRAMPDDLAFLDSNAERPAQPKLNAEARAQTEHYLVRVEIPKGKPPGESWTVQARDFAAQLEIARGHFAEVLPAPAKPVGMAEVIVFANEEAYHDYADVDPLMSLAESAGMFIPDRHQLLVDGRSDPVFALRILFHEGFHEYVHATGVQIPTWLNEGLADYVGGITIQDGRLTARGRSDQDRVDVLRNAFATGWPGMPFATMLKAEQKEFYGVLRSLQYAQAWSLVHFFRHAKGGEYQTPFEAYLQALVKGSTPTQAAAAALGKIDLEALQAEWLEYVKTLK